MCSNTLVIYLFYTRIRQYSWKHGNLNKKYLSSHGNGKTYFFDDALNIILLQMTKNLYIFHKKCNFIFVMKTLADVKRKKRRRDINQNRSGRTGDRVKCWIFHQYKIYEEYILIIISCKGLKSLKLYLEKTSAEILVSHHWFSHSFTDLSINYFENIKINLLKPLVETL